MADDIIILENYIDEETCQDWIEFADKKAGVPAPVGQTSSKGKIDYQVSSFFVADRINFIFELKRKKLVKQLFQEIYQKIVKQHYNSDIEWFELQHMLRYVSGGHYVNHADSESFDQEKKQWVKGVDRDYSCIVYLNSEFTGGALVFPSLNIRLQPKAGLVVLFPSDHRFLHSVEETLSGKRYIIVTWASERGVP